MGKLIDTTYNDIKSMSDKELDSFIAKARKQLSQRRIRMEQSDFREYSPAYASAKKQGLFKDLDYQRRQWKKRVNRRKPSRQAVRGRKERFIGQVLNFMRSETSTVRGAKKYKQNIEQRLGIKNLPKKKYKRLWNLYDALKRRNITYFDTSERVQNTILAHIDDKGSIDSIADKLEDEIYNGSVANDKQYDYFSDYDFTDDSSDNGSDFSF